MSTEAAMKSHEEAQATSPPVEADTTASVSTQSPWTVFSESKVKWLLIAASFAAMISPLSTSTYYPAVIALSRDYNVSVSKINLTISTYQIFQGIAPAFIAAYADTYGCRPAFLLSFAIYLGANLGLALQRNYGALLVLRCVQSSGSSGTTVLAQAMTVDLTTRAERGKYLAYAVTGSMLGPALGPVIGGLLTGFLGWRSVFWFLLILGGIVAIIIFVFFPETARPIVGDGSVAPQRWNRSALQMVSNNTARKANVDSLERKKMRMNPFMALILLWDKENFILCMSGGLLFAGYTSVTSVFAAHLQERYGFNSVQVGLCYLPIAFGSLLAYGTTARLVDWKFKREAEKQGTLISIMALLTDINHENAASIGAATNLTRCLLSAAGVAMIGPLTKAVGIGLMASIAAAIWILSGITIGIVYSRGFGWRIKKTADSDRKGQVRREEK